MPELQGSLARLTDGRRRWRGANRASVSRPLNVQLHVVIGRQQSGQSVSEWAPGQSVRCGQFMRSFQEVAEERKFSAPLDWTGLDCSQCSSQCSQCSRCRQCLYSPFSVLVPQHHSTAAPQHRGISSTLRRLLPKLHQQHSSVQPNTRVLIKEGIITCGIRLIPETLSLYRDSRNPLSSMLTDAFNTF